MEHLMNLNYKEEVEALKDEPDFEKIGDARYIGHLDVEARLYWAFCRPSGSHPSQISDSDPLVSIMAFNHSRLGAFERFSLLHKEVVKKPYLRTKVRNRARMLFRDLADNDFSELNRVLDIVPIFLEMAVDQLINGRKWNDIEADDIEATRFLARLDAITPQIKEALYAKLTNLSLLELQEVKKLLEEKISQKEQLSPLILSYYADATRQWLQTHPLHLLQQKALEGLLKRLKA